MATYTVSFLGFDGDVQTRQTLECASDDDAIDIVGDSTHPHSIDLHEGARHVVRFPPWPRVPIGGG